MDFPSETPSRVDQLIKRAEVIKASIVVPETTPTDLVPKATKETARHLAEALPGGEFSKIDPDGRLQATSLPYHMAVMYNEARSDDVWHRQPAEIARLARLDTSIRHDDNFEFLDIYANYIAQNYSTPPLHRRN